MDSLTLTPETYSKILPGCAPGEIVSIVINADNGDQAELTGTIQKSADGGIEIPLTESVEEPTGDDAVESEVPAPAGTPRKRSNTMSAAATAALGSPSY